MFTTGFLVFVFWLCPQPAAIPGPRIKPMTQQWPKQLQWQHQILNLMAPQGTPSFFFLSYKQWPYYSNQKSWWPNLMKNFSVIREQNSLARSSTPLILTQFPNIKILDPRGPLKPQMQLDMSCQDQTLWKHNLGKSVTSRF